MKLGRKLLAILFALTLVVAACGDDTDGDTTTTAGDGGTAAPATDAPTTTAGEAPATTEAPPPSGEILTDVGVDLDAGTIKVGMLSDLTGPFGPLVTAIVAGHEVYWENVNANGGINGLTVELEIRDTVYEVPNHVTFYEELKDEVVAFGHSTGSPHTVAINDALQSDEILAIPLTWYSGWTDPAIGTNLMHHGTPYCIESMNLLEYLKGQAEAAGIESPTVAIASNPGDYGQDSAVGAKLAAEALGMEVVYDGEGAIVAGQDLTPIANEIVGSGADIVWVTTSPTPFSEIYGAAIAQGFQALWSGAGPSWNPAFLDSPIADAIERDFYVSFYAQTWGGESAGMQEMRALFGELRPDAPPNDYYGEGFVEAAILDAALRKAYENGDMTQAGVLTAAKSLESVTFNGLAPDETYVGDANEQLQRKLNIYRPSKADREAGGTGSLLIEENYTSDLAAGYDFQEACFKL